MLSCVERICGPFSILAWPLLRFLLVILMIVKEASYLPLERRCLLQITDGTRAVEELEASWERYSGCFGSAVNI